MAIRKRYIEELMGNPKECFAQPDNPADHLQLRLIFTLGAIVVEEL